MSLNKIEPKQTDNPLKSFIMLKNILKLNGAQVISKKAQKTITGGGSDLLACKCPDGSLVVAHGTSCEIVISQFCSLEF